MLLMSIAMLLSRGDWCSPAVIVNAMFLVCTIAEVYNSIKFGTYIHEETAALICLSLTLFTVSSLSVGLFQRGKLNAIVSDAVSIRSVSLPNYLIISGALFAILVVVMHARDVLSTFGTIGASGNWNERMNAYRVADAYGDGLGDGGISGITNLLSRLLTPVSLVWLYLGINNRIAGKTASPLYFVPAISSLCCELLTGVRIGAIRFFCAAVVMIWILSNKKSHWSNHLKLSTLVKVVILFILAGALFWGIAWLVGRQVETGLIDYLCSYIGYSFVSLDAFLQEHFPFTEMFGSQTFLAIYSSIGRWFDLPGLISSGNYEFRYFQGVELGNIYTALRPWYADFGVGGVVFFSIACGAAYSYLYERSKQASMTSDICLSALVYAQFSIGLFAMPLVSLITQGVLAISTPFEIVLMYVIMRFTYARCRQDSFLVEMQTQV